MLLLVAVIKISILILAKCKTFDLELYLPITIGLILPVNFKMVYPLACGATFSTERMGSTSLPEI